MYDKLNANKILKDKRIKSVNKRVVIREVILLSDRDQGCTATNRWFMDEFGLSVNTVTDAIKEALELGFISVLEEGGRRVIRLSKNDNKLSKSEREEALEKMIESLKNERDSLKKMIEVIKKRETYEEEEKEENKKEEEVATTTAKEFDSTSPVDIYERIKKYFEENLNEYNGIRTMYYPKRESESITDVKTAIKETLRELSGWLASERSNRADIYNSNDRGFIKAKFGTFLTTKRKRNNTKIYQNAN